MGCKSHRPSRSPDELIAALCAIVFDGLCTHDSFVLHTGTRPGSTAVRSLVRLPHWCAPLRRLRAAPAKTCRAWSYAPPGAFLRGGRGLPLGRQQFALLWGAGAVVQAPPSRLRRRSDGRCAVVAAQERFQGEWLLLLACRWQGVVVVAQGAARCGSLCLRCGKMWQPVHKAWQGVAACAQRHGKV
eukprot:1158122-Pelagomonas_calceolata.AAC.22